MNETNQSLKAIFIEYNDSAFGQWEEREKNHMHSSQKQRQQQSPEREKRTSYKRGEIIYTHMYIIQYATTQDGRTQAGAKGRLWHPVLISAGRRLHRCVSESTRKPELSHCNK